MAQAGIRSNRELKKALVEVGYRISEPTLSRLRKTPCKTVDIGLLSALCCVLNCQIGDLIYPDGGWPDRSREADRYGHADRRDRAQSSAPPALPATPEAKPITKAPHPITGPKARLLSFSKRLST
ncbi:hypothetical protein GCM10028794_09520 [Silanimonas algicola]